MGSPYSWKARGINWVRTESTKEGMLRVAQLEVTHSKDIFNHTTCPSFLVLHCSFPGSFLQGLYSLRLSEVLLLSASLAIFFPVIFRHWPTVHHEDIYLASDYCILGFPSPGSATRRSR